MIAGRFDFTGNNSIVQGKTLRVRIKLEDAEKLPLPVADLEFRAAFKKDLDGPNILFLSTNTELAGITPGSSIVVEPDGEEGTIELVVTDEAMEAILHTAWTAVSFAGAPTKYKGVWELEAEDSEAPGDTFPVLAGKVNFIREVVR
jgi:hypothetical protein